MRALAAVRAATPPTAIKPAFVTLDDGKSSGGSSSRRSSRLLLSNIRTASVPPHSLARDAFAIASTSSRLVMLVRLSMPILPASSTS
jgi:hypothetical protein